MNKVSIIVESILAAGVVALFILFFTYNPWAKKTANADVEAQGELLPIAVVNTDSILTHYTLAVESSDKLQSQYEESMVKLDSRERAESEQNRLQNKEQQLMAKQQDLENLRQQLSSDFMKQQAALTQQLQDSVQAYLREYNADGHLHIILNDAVLMNKVAGYDITDEVIEGLNKRYGK